LSAGALFHYASGKKFRNWRIEIPVCPLLVCEDLPHDQPNPLSEQDNTMPSKRKIEFLSGAGLNPD